MLCPPGGASRPLRSAVPSRLQQLDLGHYKRQPPARCSATVGPLGTRRRWADSRDPDQHVIVSGHRLVDPGELQDIRRAGPAVDDRLDRVLLLPCEVVGGSHGDDDLSPSVSLLQIPDGLGDLAQWVGPVDDRRHLAGLDQLLQHQQVGSSFLGDQRPQPLAHQR
jgi:hypothetical protein